MLFNSPFFLFYFLPITLALNFLFLKFKLRNTVLLILSLLFYILGEGELVLLMVGSITLNFFLGKWIAKGSKTSLVVGVVVNLLILIINKYTNFFIDSINPVLTAFELGNLPQLQIKLPVGVSFYTFQSISYLIDVYRKDTKAQKSYVDLALYVALFPQLIAGPIVRYKDISLQLAKPKLSFNDFSDGVERFVLGFLKKVLIANVLAQQADLIFELDYGQISAATAWWGILLYTFQIYFDFSGYSDMAIGLGRMLGFKFLENFNLPYISTSIREFWTRWHISLSNWFRDYLYIPLGGNRGTNFETYRNLSIVFLLTGFWHGASWSFILWGIIHGVFIVIERAGLNKVLDRFRALGWLYTFMVVVLAWVFFRVEHISDALNYVQVMFTGADNPIYKWNFFVNSEVAFTFLVACVFSFNLIPSFITKNSHKWLQTLKYGVMLLLFAYGIIVMSAGSYNPFIYFRF